MRTFSVHEFVVIATVLMFLLGSPRQLSAEETPAPQAAEASASTSDGSNHVRKEARFEREIETFLNEQFKTVNEYLGAVIFWNCAGWIADKTDDQGRSVPQKNADGQVVKDDNGDPIAQPLYNLPFVVAVLVLGSIFFTFRYGWINIRGFRHCINIIRGKYDDPNDAGEITHFQALTSALSATIGLGNIAGVAIAVRTGGPGAIFWMMAIAVFGMSSKFSCCTLSQMYRKIAGDGEVSGGPMYYLEMGIRDRGHRWGVLGHGLGKVLAIIFAFMCIGGAFGGGNMFQSNQAFEALSTNFDFIPTADEDMWSARIFGIVMACLVGLVVLGGIKRIGAATSKIVPFMCLLYVGAGLWIVLKNVQAVPDAVQLIITSAFSSYAALAGGFIGVLVVGVTRAAFSNEAGIGSAAIAHAAAKTDEPVREGIVAMIGPFIDTIVICAMTGIVVTVTGAYDDPDLPGEGVAVTTRAFSEAAAWFPYVLCISIVLFAYSTMISWCYYGERAWSYLFGRDFLIVYRVLFLGFVFAGAVMKLGAVIDFSDLMILGMAFPNIVGMVILAPKVKAKLDDYWGRYKTGQMTEYS